jgi:hypothetical protein
LVRGRTFPPFFFGRHPGRKVAARPSGAWGLTERCRCTLHWDTAHWALLSSRLPVLWLWAPLSLALSTLALLSFKLCLSLFNLQFFASPIRPFCARLFRGSKLDFQSCAQRLVRFESTSFVLEAHPIPVSPIVFSRSRASSSRIATLDLRTAAPISTLPLVADTRRDRHAC